MKKLYILLSLFVIQPFISAQQGQLESGALGPIGKDIDYLGNPFRCGEHGTGLIVLLRDAHFTLLYRIPVLFGEKLCDACYRICILCLDSSRAEHEMSLEEQLQRTMQAIRCIGQKIKDIANEPEVVLRLKCIQERLIQHAQTILDTMQRIEEQNGSSQ